MMDGNARRAGIVDILRKEDKPVSGGRLATIFSVSRQVIVQDIALLRAENKNILSTYKGYIIQEHTSGTLYTRSFHVKHTEDEMEDELNTIVDLGGKVLDVVVEHSVYGAITADLILKTRKDVREFAEKFKKNNARQLMSLSDGTHYHTVCADSIQILDYITEELRRKGYLIDVQGGR